MKQSNFFDDGSPFLQHPLLTPQRTRLEVDFLVSRLLTVPTSRVLDVGCGFGRHSVELALRGYEVVGIDPSAAMIAASRARAATAGVKAQFVQASGGSFVSDKPFDAAICLFTTLGQINQKADHSAELLANLCRALRPGGRLLLEVPQRSVAVAQLKMNERLGGPEQYMIITRQYDAKTQVVSETFKQFTPELSRSYLLRYRLFDRLELRRLLKQAGFVLTDEFADYEGAPLADNSPTILLLGKKTCSTG